MQSDMAYLPKFVYMIVTLMMLMMTMEMNKMIFKIVLMLAMTIISIMCGYCMKVAKREKTFGIQMLSHWDIITDVTSI